MVKFSVYLNRLVFVMHLQLRRFVWFLVTMIDQHYLSAFVKCILSLTMTVFGILNQLIVFAYIIRDVGVGWDWHN